MSWTSAPPSKPGLYWYRRDGAAEICEITLHDDGVGLDDRVRIWRIADAIDSALPPGYCEWYGPINPPE
jgi:hypothetical protein